jgi:sugar O-acyltransferase (sialic acid O-acetyltransferase NeuD family)
MAKRVIILGTGGNCVDILDTINSINETAVTPQYTCLGFLDDNPQEWGRVIHGAPILGPLEKAGEYDDCYFVNGIGSAANFWRKPEIIARVNVPPERFCTLIHPTASVSKMGRIGRGVVVFQNATITSGAAVGDHVIVLPNSIISHDDIIGDYTIIAGGASISGEVRIGEACYIGANAAVKERLTIGKHSLIGMGAVVLQSVPEKSVMVGNPARFLRPTY